MPKHVVALVAAFLIQTGVPVAQIDQKCLHDRAEQPAEGARRQDALQLAARINMAEATTKLTGRYRPLAELRNLPPTPRGFDLRLLTDGMTYTLSITDRLDLCRYAIFSGEEGLIYEGVPSSGSVGPRLLSQAR